MTDQLIADNEVSDATEEGSLHDDSAGRNEKANVDGRLTPRRRRWPALLMGAVLGGGATLGFITWSDQDGASEIDAAQEVVSLTTVTVETVDLIEEVEWEGTLASGLETTVASPSSGTVTDATPAGETVGRGDIIATIDNYPVVALIGSIPMWRDLDVGDEGSDVLQLETNLSALGFNTDGDVRIDDTYTYSTADMVEEWQESLDVDETGEVNIADVVVIAGDSMVKASPAIGSSVQSGSDFITLDTLSVAYDVVGWEYDADTNGLVEAVAAADTMVEQGTVLYTADEVDVVAVIEADVGSQAVLNAFAEGDVEVIESTLLYLGFDPDAAMEIDDEIDLASAAAIIRWQESIGLPATGSSNPSDYVLVPADREFLVTSTMVVVGDELADGKVVMTLGSPTLELTAQVAITETDEFDVGDPVVIEQVDESTFQAVVVEIDDVTTEAADGGEPTVTVTFEVVEQPNEYISGSVTITTESSRIDGAIVVPTRALITLSEGGFAVEKSNSDGTTELVAIELGTFDDGVVEVVSGDIASGDVIVVPS